MASSAETCCLLYPVLCFVYCILTDLYQFVDYEINLRKGIALIQSTLNYLILILVYKYILALFMVASSHILNRRFEQTLVVGVTLNCCLC